ncbi:MAG TPA: glycoside hydrolase family 44 protein [Kofleriaceae bacterium]|nr:glycoside hydrolase family 44 protein [Kofleriaceae bacterium]
MRGSRVLAIAIVAAVAACGSSHSNSRGDGGAPADGGALTAWCAAHASTGSASPGSGLSFDIDICGGPARQYDPPSGPTPVSPYVYGINGFGTFVASPTKFGLIRQGGDDNSAYNWTNDFHNTGGDYCYFQGTATSHANLAGRYTDPTGDTIPAALAKGEAFLATVPILDFVAASYNRNTGYDTATMTGDVCPGTDAAGCTNRNGSVRANVVDKAQGDPGFNSALAFAYANDGSTTKTNSPAFVPNVMMKGSALCACATGTTQCSSCSVGTNPVAQDEFVNFVMTAYSSTAPIFFDLDNEPNYWIGTHPEIHPNNCSNGSVTWDEIATRDLAAASAIKSVWASAKVFGPVVAGDGMAYGGDYASPHFIAGTEEFSDWYLQQVAAASTTTQLLDVFDVHYYTTGGTDAQCLESPRLFWDPNATDISAAETNSLDFNYGDHSYWDQYWYPRQVIPRLFRKIAAAFGSSSATAPELSFSEYNAGCETAISGGVAEADLLGIFGREGVFAATAWPLQSLANNYLVAAYALYRNYDGAGAVVGDTTVRAMTSDDKTTSVYAFAHSDSAQELELVAINKQGSAQMASIVIASAPVFTTAKVYQLVDGAPAVAAANGATPSCAAGTCTLQLSLPATSATTIVLR